MHQTIEERRRCVTCREWTRFGRPTREGWQCAKCAIEEAVELDLRARRRLVPRGARLVRISNQED